MFLAYVFFKFLKFLKLILIIWNINFNLAMWVTIKKIEWINMERIVMTIMGMFDEKTYHQVSIQQIEQRGLGPFFTDRRILPQ